MTDRIKSEDGEFAAEFIGDTLFITGEDDNRAISSDELAEMVETDFPVLVS